MSWLTKLLGLAGTAATGGWSWLAGLASTLLGWLLKLLTVMLAYWGGKRAGRKAERADINEEVLDAIKRAQAARRAVDHSPDGVRLDSRNRD